MDHEILEKNLRTVMFTFTNENNGITEINRYLESLDAEIFKIFDQSPIRYGFVRLRSIESAIEVMQTTKNSRIHFRHTSYSNWSVQNNNEILHSMQMLNSDCLLHIFNFLSLADMVKLSQHNEHLSGLVSRKLKTVRISQSTVGDDFGFLNFAYVMKLYGREVVNIFVSLDSFTGKVFGTHMFQTKYTIIFIINSFASSKLKSVHLHGFNLSMEELLIIEKNFFLLKNPAVKVELT